jgi:hypothetical protein
MSSRSSQSEISREDRFLEGLATRRKSTGTSVSLTAKEQTHVCVNAHWNCGQKENDKLPYSLKQLESAYREAFYDGSKLKDEYARHGILEIPKSFPAKDRETGYVVYKRRWFCNRLSNLTTPTKRKFCNQLISTKQPREKMEKDLKHSCRAVARQGCTFDEDAFPFRLRDLERMWKEAVHSTIVGREAQQEALLTSREWEKFRRLRLGAGFERRRFGKEKWYCWKLARGAVGGNLTERTYCSIIKRRIKQKKYGIAHEQWVSWEKLGPVEFQKRIGEVFAPFAYEIPSTRENTCAKMTVPRAFLNHQYFVRYYMTPSNPQKGLLLWHDVGTGKTCSAISALSYAFLYPEWKIMWVTRRKLRDTPLEAIFKDMCHRVIRQEVRRFMRERDAGVSDPRGLDPEKLARSKMSREDDAIYNWTALYTKYFTQHSPTSWGLGGREYRIMNYAGSKGFGEFCKSPNPKLRQDRHDPLRRTLVIIDEAHNLYNTSDLPSDERVSASQIRAIEKRIHESYEKSGEDSCRLLLLTATPINDRGPPTLLTKLLNLLIPERSRLLPVDEKGIYERYFRENTMGEVCPGMQCNLERFMKDTKGLISYFMGNRQVNLFAQKRIGSIIRVNVKRDQYAHILNCIGAKKEPAKRGRKPTKQKTPTTPELEERRSEGRTPTPIIISDVSDMQRFKLPKQDGPPTKRPFKVRRDKFQTQASTNKTVECLQRHGSWGTLPRNMILDGKSAQKLDQKKKGLALENFRKEFPKYSSKYEALLLELMEQDRRDMEKFGRTFKHAIFTDVTSHGYGTKTLGAVFMSSGFENARYIKTSHGLHTSFSVEPASTAQREKKNRFLILSTSSIKGHYYFASKNMNNNPPSIEDRSKMASAAKSVYNNLEQNPNGEEARIIMMDSGFKEGISLYDVRYFWLMEPPLSRSALTQSIGRVVRMCGHSDAMYNLRDRNGNVESGWNVYINALYSQLGDTQQSVYSFQIASKEIQRQSHMRDGLIKMGMLAAVDKFLTVAVHEYSPEDFQNFEERFANTFNIP